MRLKKYIFIGVTILVIILFNGCATTYSIHVIDEESKESISGIPIEIIDENGREKLISNESNADGQYIFDLKEIPGDSFKIEITGRDYFERNEWITTPGNSTEMQFLLEKRVTIITGYVLERSTLTEISGCNITTSPVTTTALTDDKGMFVLKSNGFAEGLPYTIFASKPPTYNEKSTRVTPKINKKNDLPNSIYLDKIIIEEVERDTLENIDYPRGVGIPVN